MANPVELAKLIKFGLLDLPADNAHHQFEALCRHLAKAVIVTNVLPATGPVSAGGDQGRDFETFRTYLTRELPFAIGFLALATTDTIVFACTTQREGLKSKFEDDIKAICTQGTKVDRIYICATADVPTRLRHDTQQWAAATYSVGLDILDGTAIAELLSEPDHFWIAEHFLGLPAVVAPSAPEPALPGWYRSLRDYWQIAEPQPFNLGDMLDLRRGLRHSIPPGPARADLDGWLTLMHRLAEDTPSGSVRMQATYEITMARSRGKADLRPAESLIRRFIVEALSCDDPSILFDSSVLIQGCTAAACLSQTDIPLDEVLSWIPSFRAHLDQLLADEWGPNTRAGLLQAASHLALQYDYTGVTGGGTASLEDVDAQYRGLMEAIEQGSLQDHLSSAPLVDIDTGMRHLLELTQLLQHAPAYPVSTITTFIDLLTASIQDHPLYRQICDGMDEAIQRQEGEAAIADRCRQRASALQEAGRPLDALREFHQAKVNWFHGDTLPGTLRAMAAIADIYASLGMFLAAKKYALAMATIAQGSLDPENRELVPMGLFAAAHLDHRCGAWFASAELASTASLAHAAYSPAPGNLDWHLFIEQAARDQAITMTIARQTRPRFEPALWEILEYGHLAEFTRMMADSLQSAGISRTEEQWLEWLPNDAGAPFGDVGQERTISFSASGIRWTVHGRNDQATVLAAEDFTSTLQILLVEFASLDTVMLHHEVDVEIRCYPAGARPEDTYLTRFENGRRLWLLYMPAQPQTEVMELSRQHVLALTFQVLLGNSLLDKELFIELMERAATSGLFHKVEVGRPYQELATFRTTQPPFSDRRYRGLAKGTVMPRGSSPHLVPPTSKGPGYSPDRARQILADRYQTLPVPVRYTMPRLLADPDVRRLFHQLRREGWKDWHLFSVVVNQTLNHRVTVKYGQMTIDTLPLLKDKFLDEAYRLEEVDDPGVSAATITTDVMAKGIKMVASTSLRAWDLTLHHDGTDPALVLDLLARRYGFWDDDTTHPDLLEDGSVAASSHLSS